MMIARSKIKNLDDAIASCANYVETYGVLSELNIDIIEQGEKVVVKYKGVVDINNAFIKIYGSTNNNSMTFATTINTLKSLEAEIITMSNNGEVVDTKYNRHASVVYLKGKLVSMDAIKVEYINSAPHTLLHKRNSMFIVGLVEDFNIEEKWIDLFVFNDYYHQRIRITIDPNTCWSKLNPNDVIRCWFGLKSYDTMYPPIQCTNFEKTDILISDKVTNQAKQEYEIYQHTLEQNYGKSQM